MEPDRAIEIVQALADGVDPYSGDRFPSGSPYQQADTVGALHLALEGLTKLRRSTARKTGPGRVWTEDEEKELLREFDDKIDVEEIAAKHDRTNGAIWARLEKLDTVSIAKTSSAQCPIPRPRITRASRVRPGRLCRPAAITTTSPFSRIRTARSILQGCPSPGLQAVRSLSRRNGLKPGAHPSRPRSAARIERRRSRQLKQAVCAVNPCAALCRRCWWLRSLVSATLPRPRRGQASRQVSLFRFAAERDLSLILLAGGLRRSPLRPSLQGEPRFARLSLWPPLSPQPSRKLLRASAWRCRTSAQLPRRPRCRLRLHRSPRDRMVFRSRKALLSFLPLPRSG